MRTRNSLPESAVRGHQGNEVIRAILYPGPNGTGGGDGCDIFALMEGRVMERKKASDYPQELLNLFDRYVHGEIDRRDFLEGAKKFVVGGVSAAAIWESLRPNYAWAQQVPKDDSRIKTEYLTVDSPQGNGKIKGYFVRPANSTGKLPAVLVIHENRGLNPYIEDVARRLGTSNFIAFA